VLQVFADKWLEHPLQPHRDCHGTPCLATTERGELAMTK